MMVGLSILKHNHLSLSLKILETKPKDLIDYLRIIWLNSQKNAKQSFITLSRQNPKRSYGLHDHHTSKNDGTEKLLPSTQTTSPLNSQITFKELACLRKRLYGNMPQLKKSRAI